MCPYQLSKNDYHLQKWWRNIRKTYTYIFHRTLLLIKQHSLQSCSLTPPNVQVSRVFLEAWNGERWRNSKAWASSVATAELERQRPTHERFVPIEFSFHFQSSFCERLSTQGFAIRMEGLDFHTFEKFCSFYRNV